MPAVKKISPCLWFDDQAEEAANFYVSVFPNSEITEVSRYGEAGPRAAGSVMVVSFRLDGQEMKLTAFGEPGPKVGQDAGGQEVSADTRTFEVDQPARDRVLRFLTVRQIHKKMPPPRRPRTEPRSEEENRGPRE